MEEEIIDAPQPLQDENTMHPALVILITVGTVLAGALGGSVLILGIYWLKGMDMQDIIAGIDTLSPTGDRNLLRWTMLINHLTMFIIPGFIIPFFVSHRLWLRPRRVFAFLHLDKKPRTDHVLIAFALLVVSMPLVQYSYLLNRLIPLPEWSRALEGDTERLISGLLAYKRYYEVFFNLLIIAIIPGLGEELIFRGLIQKHFLLWTKKIVLSILVTAAFFSFFHFQFEGFLPRFILGALLGYTFVATNNLWVPVLLHFLNNASQIILYYMMPESMSTEATEEMLKDLTWYNITFAVLASGILTWWVGRMLWRRREE